jgi:hypothetical protein
MVNKIKNFVKNKPTMCEIIKVDYAKASTIVIPPGDTATFITIDNYNVVGCVVTLTFSTDANIGATVNLTCAVNNFGLPVFTPIDPIYGFGQTIIVTAPTMTISFTLDAGTYYVLRLSLPNISPVIYSNEVGFENMAGCVIYTPNNLAITSVVLINTYNEPFFNSLVYVYTINFTSDASLPRNIYYSLFTAGIFGPPDWATYVKKNVTSNSFTIEVGTFLQSVTKIRMRIGMLVSNEVNL